MFDYLRPSTLEEALDALLDAKSKSEKCIVLAGGTDLLVRMRTQPIECQTLLSLADVLEMKGIRSSGGYNEIGVGTSLHELENSPVIRAKFPALSQAASSMATLQIRNRATVGGNLCNASPAADLAPPLIVLDAKLRVRSKEGERQIPCREFFRGPELTCLHSHELLTEVVIPQDRESREGRASLYIKFNPRSSVDIALVGAAAFVGADTQGVCREVCLALAGVAPFPFEVKELRSILLDHKLDALLCEQSQVQEQIEKLVKKAVSPITDIRGSSDYKARMAVAISKRALQLAMNRCMASESSQGKEKMQ